jgi:uncharacterized protein YcbK (DUF882 family)
MRRALCVAATLLSGLCLTAEVMADQANSLKVIPNAGNAVTSLIELDTAQRVCRRALTWSRDSWEPELTSEVREAKRLGLSVEDCKQTLLLIAENSAMLETKRHAHDRMAVQIAKAVKDDSSKDSSRLPVLVDVISGEEADVGERLIPINRDDKGSALGSTFFPTNSPGAVKTDQPTPSLTINTLSTEDSVKLEERISSLEKKLGDPSVTTLPDQIVCKAALANSGLQWESGPEFRVLVEEVMTRGLSVEQCRAALKVAALPDAVRFEAQQPEGVTVDKPSVVSGGATGADEEDQFLSVDEYLSPPKPRTKPASQAIDGVEDGVRDMAMPDVKTTMETDSPVNSATLETRTIYLNREASGEKASITYMKAGKHIPSAMRKINYLLRDLNSGTVGVVDPRVIDLIWELHADLNSNQPIQIVRAYSNSHQAIDGTVGDEHRTHGAGRAVDFYFPDVPTIEVRNSALVREAGGVGYYNSGGGSKSFLHIDTGPMRYWGPAISSSQMATIMRDYRKTVGARINNKGMSAIPEVEIALSGGSVSGDPSSGSEAPNSSHSKDQGRPKETQAEIESRRSVDRSTAVKEWLSYGSKPYRMVPIVAKSGIGSRKALIRIKPDTKESIRENCKEYYVGDSTLDLGECIKMVVQEQRSLNRTVYGDCKRRTWTDMYGEQFYLKGRNKEFESSGENEFIIVHRRTGEVLGPSMASGYTYQLDIIESLCPNFRRTKLPN